MIEQPKTTIIEGARYSIDESPDAPLEKAEKVRLIDEEVIVIKEDPITSNIRKTIRHLHSIGGFAARWRGLSISVFYHMAHAFVANLISAFVFGGLLFGMPAYIISSLLLARIHMTWTHIMISKPSQKPWYKRIGTEKKIWKVLLLPSFVFAASQQLTVALPTALFFVLGLHRSEDFALSNDLSTADRWTLGLKFASIPITALAVALLILLPASVTLTRIEASLLPEEEETVVNFDRTLNGAVSASITLGGTSPGKSLFIEAWRSFDRAARIRVIKLYAKLLLIQFVVAIVGMQLMIGEIFILGRERLVTIAQAGSAQLQLAAMGVEQN